MKIKTVSSLFCAAAFFGTASMAMAGAYGEPEQAEEMPRPAPVAEEVAPSAEFKPFPYIVVGGLYGQGFHEGDVHQINKHYGWGWNARVGYRFIEMLAAEIIAEHVVEFDADAGGGGSTSNIDRKDATVLANLKFFPIQGFCEPFIEVGGGYMYADAGNNNEIVSASPLITTHGTVDDGSAFGARVGAGLDIYATENVFVEGDVAYTWGTGDAHNHEYLTISLGIGYAFN
jgi:outer membrane protein W